MSDDRAAGPGFAMQNSNAAADDELHPLREVPRWTWPGDADGDEP
jgi:hemoglobin